MDFNLDTGKASENLRKRLYILGICAALNTKALFTDETSAFRNPTEPDRDQEVKVKFRTARDNVDEVTLFYGSDPAQMNEINMRFSYSDKMFDYFTATIPPMDQPYTYFFRIVSGKSFCYYNMHGVDSQRNDYYSFRVTPGFHTPDWAKGAVFYQIFVDRFCNGDTSNDVVDDEYAYIGQHVKQVKDWGRYPEAMDVRDFYGGDLQGVMDKLDYIQGLGVQVIYLNPVFVSPSNHKYDIQDYDYIDPHYGRIVVDQGETLGEGDLDNSHATRYISRVTDRANLEASNQFFAELVSEVHRRGMKIILDGVFNHCGSFNKWLDRERIYEDQEGYEKGAYIAEDSPYHSFFQFFDGGSWPYNTAYDGWWGHDTLPKLNYEGSEKLQEYILNIGRKWVSPPYNCDGWRLDVAADLGHSEDFNHDFWRRFRDAVKEANPDAIILAEHYGDPGSWLQGDQWDTVMNYDAFMEPVTWFLTGMEKHSDEFRGDLLGNAEAFCGAMSHHMTRFQTPSLQTAMNELSNHDHSRFLTRTNRKVGRTATMGPEAANTDVDKGVFREAVVMQMTWPGAPTIYYGDEAGLCGWTDPDNRRTYPWGHEDQDLISFHRDIIRIHRESTALRTGSVKIISAFRKFLAYGRFDDSERYLICVNNNYDPVKVTLPVWQLNITGDAALIRMIATSRDGYTADPAQETCSNGFLSVEIPPECAVIYKALD